MNIIQNALKGISMPQFYKWGSVLFSIGALGGMINLYMKWGVTNIGEKISLTSSIFLQALFISLFLTMYFQTRGQFNPQEKIVEDPALDNFIKELQLDDKSKGRSKNVKKNNINN